MPLRFFANAEELGDWFRDHHDKLDEQWIGFYKKHTGIPSIDWAQSVDVALCFGWIDGLRKSLGATSYKIRFTPRRAGSRWSKRNLSRMEALMAEGLVEEAGLAVFQARDTSLPDDQTAARALPASLEKRIRGRPRAWGFFRATRLSYRKGASAWINSAKKEETRLRRLDQLIECCERGEPVPPLSWGGRPVSKRD